MDQITPQVPQATQPEAIQSAPESPFFKKYKFTLIALFILILAAIPVLLMHTTAKLSSAPVAEVSRTVIISPTPTPLTTQTANTALTQEDTTIQTGLNQMDTDLQSVDKIDSSQDTTNGL